MCILLSSGPPRPGDLSSTLIGIGGVAARADAKHVVAAHGRVALRSWISGRRRGHPSEARASKSGGRRSGGRGRGGSSGSSTAEREVRRHAAISLGSAAHRRRCRRCSRAKLESAPRCRRRRRSSEVKGRGSAGGRCGLAEGCPRTRTRSRPSERIRRRSSLSGILRGRAKREHSAASCTRRGTASS